MEQYQRDYAKYIKEHTSNVKKAYRWLMDNVERSELHIEHADKLENNINSHDLSKWSAEEFKPYALYFNVDKTAYLDQFNKAWNHHQKCNPHHWQYWVLMEDDNDGNTVCIPMEQEYIIEMICDWWAFSFKSGDLTEIFSWYEANKHKQKMHPDTRAEVERLLKVIKQALDK